MTLDESVMRTITKKLGSSLVSKRDELKDIAKKSNRSKSVVYQTLHVPKKKISSIVRQITL